MNNAGVRVFQASKNKTTLRNDTILTPNHELNYEQDDSVHIDAILEWKLQNCQVGGIYGTARRAIRIYSISKWQ
jgi:hypothetical protein